MVNSRPALGVVVAVSVGMAAACAGISVGGVTPAAGPSQSKRANTNEFTDPFAYCAAVGTVDAPGDSYAGPKVPDEIITGYKKAAGLETSTEPVQVMRETTIWRCMGGKVYACNFGANLPCDSKADTNNSATPAMESYCNANADSDSIPMSVTGHATIYSWHCAGKHAATLEQIDQADPAGYLKRIWYQIPSNP